MSIIIRLQRLAWSASAADVREFFRGMTIPEGGVHIVGGRDGDAFIAFASDEDARLAMRLDNKRLKDQRVKLYLSSRQEMQKVIEKARTEYAGMTNQGSTAGAVAPPTMGGAASGPASSGLDDDPTNGGGGSTGAGSSRRSHKRRGSRSRSRSSSRDRSGMAQDDIYYGSSPNGSGGQRYRTGSRSPDTKRTAPGGLSGMVPQQQQSAYGKQQQMSANVMQGQTPSHLLSQLNSAILSSNQNPASSNITGYGSFPGSAQQQSQSLAPASGLPPPHQPSQASLLDPRTQLGSHAHQYHQQLQQQQQAQNLSMGGGSNFGGPGGQPMPQQGQGQPQTGLGQSHFQQLQTPTGYPAAGSALTQQEQQFSFPSSQYQMPGPGQGQAQAQTSHPAYHHLPPPSQQQSQLPPPMAPFQQSSQAGSLLPDSSGSSSFSDFDARNSAGAFGSGSQQQSFGQKSVPYPTQSSYQTSSYDFSRQPPGPILPPVSIPPPSDYSSGGRRNRLTLLPEPAADDPSAGSRRGPMPQIGEQQMKNLMDINLDGFQPSAGGLDQQTPVSMIGQTTTGSGGPFGQSQSTTLQGPPPPQPFLPAVGQKIQMHIQQQQLHNMSLPPPLPHQIFREGVFMDSAQFPIGPPPPILTTNQERDFFAGQMPISGSMVLERLEPNCCICLENVPQDLLRYGEIRRFFQFLTLEGSESIKILPEVSRVYCRFGNKLETDQALRFDGRQGIRIRPCPDLEFDSVLDTLRANRRQEESPEPISGGPGAGAGSTRSSFDSKSGRGQLSSGSPWDLTEGRFLVAISNVGYRVDDKEIWDLVSRLRPRSLRRRMVYKNGRMMTSDEAYVEFLNQKDAEEALRLRGKVVGGRPIGVYATSLKRIGNQETRLYEPRRSPDYQTLSGPAAERDGRENRGAGTGGGSSSSLDHDNRRPTSSRDLERDSRDSAGTRTSTRSDRDRDRDRDRERGDRAEPRDRADPRDRTETRDRVDPRDRSDARDRDQSSSARGSGRRRSRDRDQTQKTSRDRSRSKDRYSKDTSKDSSSKDSSRSEEKSRDTKEKRDKSNNSPKEKDRDFRYNEHRSQSEQAPPTIPMPTIKPDPSIFENAPATTSTPIHPQQPQNPQPAHVQHERCTCVFMSGLSPIMQIRDISNFFNGLRIAHGGIRIMREPKGTAYVEFCSIRDCDAAMNKNKEYVGVQVVNLRACPKSEMVEAVQKQYGLAPQPGSTVKDQPPPQPLMAEPTPLIVPEIKENLAPPQQMINNFGGTGGAGGQNSMAPNNQLRPPNLFDSEIRPPFLNMGQRSLMNFGARNPYNNPLQQRPSFFGGQNQPSPFPPTTRPSAAVAPNPRGHVGLLGNEPPSSSDSAASNSPPPGHQHKPPVPQPQPVQQQQPQPTNQDTSANQQPPPVDQSASNGVGHVTTNGLTNGDTSPSAPPTATGQSRPAMPVIDSGVVANLGPPGAVCFVHNLPPQITLEEICALFPTEQFIEDSVRMHYSHQSGEPTGDCLLAFATPSDAESACQKTNGRVINGRALQMWVVPN